MIQYQQNGGHKMESVKLFLDFFVGRVFVKGDLSPLRVLKVPLADAVDLARRG